MNSIEFWFSQMPHALLLLRYGGVYPLCKNIVFLRVGEKDLPVCGSSMVSDKMMNSIMVAEDQAKGKAEGNTRGGDCHSNPRGPSTGTTK